MYCPVDGTEWREGITRCPEHDVELVDEPPEGYEDDETSLLEALGLQGLTGITVVTVAVASVVYAVSGVVVSGWIALATARRWTELGFFEAASFVHAAARVIAVGGLGCLAAGVLGRTWVRLGTPVAAPMDRLEHEDDAEHWLEGPAGWVMTLLSSLVLVFVLLWVATGVGISWEEAKLRNEAFSPFGPDDPSDTFINLSAVHNAAYTCGLGALVSMGALLMARAYDRIAGGR